MAKNHGKQIKNDAQYEALRDKGMSKEKSARIANSPKASKKGGQASDLGSRTKSELLAEAKKIGITGRHAMKKEELIKAIRNH
ncbi:Rho termination factor N-terminal domain-containing protein [Sphingobacterium faecium]|uniref:DUF7218 family protein n=1 Tax=Sphingobacterium faecium TaxID=34087 RepID=UPI003208FA9F